MFKKFLAVFLLFSSVSSFSVGKDNYWNKDNYLNKHPDDGKHFLTQGKDTDINHAECIRFLLKNNLVFYENENNPFYERNLVENPIALLYFLYAQMRVERYFKAIDFSEGEAVYYQAVDLQDRKVFELYPNIKLNDADREDIVDRFKQNHQQKFEEFLLFLKKNEKQFKQRLTSRNGVMVEQKLFGHFTKKDLEDFQSYLQEFVTEQKARVLQDVVLLAETYNFLKKELGPNFQKETVDLLESFQKDVLNFIRTKENEISKEKFDAFKKGKIGRGRY